MWRSSVESPHFNTSSIRDKWHRWESRSTSERRHFSSITTIRIGWKMVVRFCEMSKTSWQMGKNSVWKTIFENHSKDQYFLYGAMVEYHPISARDQSRIHQVGKNVLPGIFLGYELDAGRIWKGDILVADLKRLGKVGRIRYLSSKNQRVSSIDYSKRRWIHIPNSRWCSKICQRDLRIPRKHCKTRIDRKECRFQPRTWRWTGRVATDRVNRWRWSRPDFWSIQGEFIYRPHNEPRVQVCVPKKENVPYFHWNTLMWPGVVILIWTCCKRNELLECQFEQTFVRFVEDSRSSLYWKKNLQKDKCGPGDTHQKSIDCQTRSCRARIMDKNW